jgi:autotransporter-associated beta strand protein
MLALRSWLSGLTRIAGFSTGHRQSRKSLLRQARPLLEYLEERLTPNAYTVNNLVDDGNTGSWSWVVAQANSDPGSDTINFDPALTAKGAATISVKGPQLLTDGNGTTTITGPGANLLTLDGGSAFQILVVSRLVSADISGLTFAHGSGGLGAGIFNQGALTVTDCTFANNSAQSGGGLAESSSGTLTVLGCTFTGNTATASPGGGGLLNEGQAQVIDSTFTTNTAGLNGGAIVADGGLLSLSNCTVAANQAGTSPAAAGSGGGLYLAQGPVHLDNTLIAGNVAFFGTTASDIVVGSPNTFITQDSIYNLIGDANSAGGLFDGQSGNIVGNHGTGTIPLKNIVDATLNGNGGPTQTLALVAKSPAIDSGDPNFDPNSFTPPLSNDQRGTGFPRVGNGRIDIGAYEVEPALPITSLSFTPHVPPATTASPIGTPVGTLATVDPNPNPTFTYTLTSPTGGQLTVDNNGVIRTGQANLPAGPISVNAQVTDSFGLTLSTTFTVSIAKPITSLAFTPSVPPATTASPALTPVGTLTTIDPNPNPTFTYTLTSPTGGQLAVTTSGIIATGQPNLPAGPITVSATATDNLGLTATQMFNVVIAPVFALPAPSVPDLVAADDSGISDSDHITNVSQPRFQGSGIAGDMVQLFVDGVANASGPVDDNGHWTIQLSAALADGTYAITAQQMDAAGHQSAPSAAMAPPLVIDTRPPPPPQTVGVVDPALAWYLRNENSAGVPDAGQFSFGIPGWIAVTGDWNGDGVTTVGAYDPTTEIWHLRNENSPGAADAGEFKFGLPGAMPVTGDWDGSGHTGVGVYDPNTFTWYLTTDDAQGAPVTAQFQFGGQGLISVTGDWDGSGHTGIGVYDPATGTWYLRNEVGPGPDDAGQFVFTGPGFQPVAGDWQGSGHTGIGLYDPATATWYLRNEVGPGPDDAGEFPFGFNNWLPVTGSWGGSEGISIQLAPADRSNVSPAGNVTDNSQPHFQGTTQPNAYVQLSVNGVADAVGQADANGNWQIQVATPLPPGNYTVGAVRIDVAGNAAAQSASEAVIVSGRVNVTAGGNLVLERVVSPGIDTLELLQNGQVIDSHSTVTVAAYTVTGGPGDDALDINYTASGGFFNIPVTFNGGGGQDTLQITGGSFLADTYNYTNATDGNVHLAANADPADDTVITYTGLASLNNTGTAAGINFVLPGGAAGTPVANNAVFEASGAPASPLQLRSSNATFTSTQVFQSAGPGSPAGTMTAYTITGGPEDDTLDINYTAAGGFFNIPVTFNGGGGHDTLQITGGTFQFDTYNYTNATDGNIHLSPRTNPYDTVITYTGLASLNNTDTAVAHDFQLPAAIAGGPAFNDAVLQESGAGASPLLVRSNNATFAATQFTDPESPGDMAISAGNPGDRLTTEPLDDLTTGLIAGEGETTFRQVVVSSNLNMGDITIFADTILLNANVTTAQTQDYYGAVTLTSNVTLQAAHGGIGLTGSVDSDNTARSLNLAVLDPIFLFTIDASVGASHPLNTLHITDAGLVTLSGALAGVGQLIKDGGGTLALTNPRNGYSGTTRINSGTLDLQGALTGAGGPLLLGPGTTLTSTNHTGVIFNRPVVVPAGSNNVTISNLGAASALGGTAVEVDGSATLTGDTLGASTNGVQITGTATLTGNTLKYNQIAVRVNNGGQLTLGTGNVIQAGLPGPQGLHGLLIMGPAARLLGLTLSNTSFSGFGATPGAYYVELRNQAEQGPQIIDATHATFEGTAGASLSNTALQKVENQLYDYHVDSGVGLLQLKKGGVFAAGPNLTIFGTDGPDTINVNTSNAAQVTVSGSFGSIQDSFDVRQGRVIVFTLGGKDVVNITGAVDTEVHCGAGGDTVYGGFGHDILIGGTGNDTLIGRGTADVLIGGGGQDVLLAMGGQDILIAGSLNAGYNTYNFLNQLRAEWLDTSNTTKAMLHDLAANGVNHPDLPSEKCLLSHSGGGPSAFVYRKKGTNTDKAYGLTGNDTDLGF